MAPTDRALPRLEMMRKRNGEEAILQHEDAGEREKEGSVFDDIVVVMGRSTCMLVEI